MADNNIKMQICKTMAFLKKKKPINKQDNKPKDTTKKVNQENHRHQKNNPNKEQKKHNEAFKTFPK